MDFGFSKDASRMSSCQITKAEVIDTCFPAKKCFLHDAVGCEICELFRRILIDITNAKMCIGA